MTTLQQPQATESHNTDVALSLQNVTISYGSFEAVKNVYCEIPRGKVTAFIWPFRLWKVHGAAFIEPDERPDRGLLTQGKHSVWRR